MRKSFLFTVLSVLCIKCSEQKRNRENEGKTVSEIYTPECLPSDTDRLVYRYQNDSHIFVGFDNLKKRKLFTISWKISENNKEILEKSQTKTYLGIESEEFRSLTSVCSILAATNSKHQRAFVKRVKDCQQSVLTMNCLIESFAWSARKMEMVPYKCRC